MALRPKRDFEFHDTRRDTDHESFLAHDGYRWLKIAGITSFALALVYILIDPEPRHNGGTWYGYTLGTIGAGLIVWLSMLGVRKRYMTAARWSLKAWTSAHVYLGLALIVIGTLHTGFQLGWNVHTLAWGLMMLVIVSGIYGISVYATLPMALSTNRKEMTRAQMIEALQAIDRQLQAAAQPLRQADSDLVLATLEQDVFAANGWQRLTGKYPRCATRRAIHSFAQAADDEGIERVRALLGRRQTQLDQIRRQMRLMALLEVWLFIHIPATIALIAALIAHIVSVFYYWG
jgi:hypothetical protein